MSHFGACPRRRWAVWSQSDTSYRMGRRRKSFFLSGIGGGGREEEEKTRPIHIKFFIHLSPYRRNILETLSYIKHVRVYAAISHGERLLNTLFPQIFTLSRKIFHAVLSPLLLFTTILYISSNTFCKGSLRLP